MANKNPSPATRFTSGKVAQTNGSKGGKSKKRNEMYANCARNALKGLSTDEELEKIMKKLLERGRQGNLTAIKLILDYTDEKNDDVASDESTGVIILTEVRDE